MSGLDIAEKRIPQDGRIKIKVGKDIDIRLSTVPTSHGERIVMRLLDKSAVLQDLPHIGAWVPVLSNINELLGRSHGIISSRVQRVVVRRPRFMRVWQRSTARPETLSPSKTVEYQLNWDRSDSSKQQSRTHIRIWPSVYSSAGSRCGHGR